MIYKFENRPDDSCITAGNVISDNRNILENVKKHNVDYILIDNEYKFEIGDII